MKNKHLSTILVLTALVAVFMIAAIFFKLFGLEEWLYECCAAFIGAIITAIITLFLLSSQTDSELEQNKSAKVFEEKMAVYKAFLEKLCDVTEDRDISSEEMIQLQYQTAQIAMHTNSETILEVSKQVKDIIAKLCGKGNDNAIIMDQLFAIVKYLREELYDPSPEKDNKDALLKEAANNFKDAYDSIDNSTSKGTEEIKISTSEETSKETWEDALKRWEEKGWIKHGIEGGYFWLANNDINKGDYHNDRANFIGIYTDFYQRNHFIDGQYRGDKDFAKSAKKALGGHQNYGDWWTHFPVPYDNIPAGKFGEYLKADTGFQRLVIGYIDTLIAKIEFWHQMETLNQMIEKEGLDGWTPLSNYEWCIMFTQIENPDEKNGTPFIDVELNKDKTANVILGNRQNDINLEEWITALGLTEKAKLREADNKYIIETSLPLTDYPFNTSIAQPIIDLMRKMQQLMKTSSE